MNPLERRRYHVTGAIERGEKQPIVEVPALNHVCCVCQASLNGEPFNQELQTSHGYCQVCLDTVLNEFEQFQNRGLAY